MSKPLKVFITYARTDKEAKDKLIRSLTVMTRSGLIEIWHDTEMLGGDKWQQEIFSKHLPTSDLLLYLVSIESLASENCYKEFEVALEKKIRVIPIIFSDCDWKNDQQLSDFQILPDDGTPINEWIPEDKGWQNVVKGVRKTVDQMLSHSEHASDASEKEREAETVFQHGNILMRLGQIDEALKAYSRAIELNPKNANIYYNRGIAYCHKSDDVPSIIEDFNKAIENFNKVIELNPNYLSAYSAASETHYQLAICYYGEDNDDLAIENYTKAIELNPKLTTVYYNRGEAWLHLQEWEKAKLDLKTARNMGEDITSIFRNPYSSIAEFEQKHNVKLPEDIAAMLTPVQA